MATPSSATTLPTTIKTTWLAPSRWGAGSAPVSSVDAVDIDVT